MAKEQQTERIVIVQQSSQALPALVNIFLPGFGQLMQGRLLAALIWWVLLAAAAVSIVAGIGLVLLPLFWMICITDAAVYKPRR